MLVLLNWHYWKAKHFFHLFVWLEITLPILLLRSKHFFQAIQRHPISFAAKQKFNLQGKTSLKTKLSPLITNLTYSENVIPENFKTNFNFLIHQSKNFYGDSSKQVWCIECDASKKTMKFGPWPTKYTALYVTFWRPKLRGQFSKNLVLWIYEFLFNSGERKKNCEVLRNKNLKYGRNFRLTNCLFELKLFFVRIKQTSKSRSSEAAIQMCS